MIYMKNKGVDESLDVFACHGVGGIWGCIATGLFATLSINSGGANGLFYGNPAQLYSQIFSVVVVIIFTVIATTLILQTIKLFTSLTVTQTREAIGLDLSEHHEKGYSN